MSQKTRIFKTGEVYGVHFTGPFSRRNCMWHASIGVQVFIAKRSNSLTRPTYSYVSNCKDFAAHAMRANEGTRTAEADNYTTHNKPKRRISMPSAGYKPTISAIKWLQTYALDRMATGIGISCKHVLVLFPVR
jgi:hypothetical protein